MKYYIFKEWFTLFTAFSTAKYEKLQELMTLRSEIHEPNLTTRIIFNHWKANRARYAESIKETNDILEKMAESYTSEKTTNILLIFRNEELIELLQKSEDDIKNLECEKEKMKESHTREMENLKKKIEELEEKISMSAVSEVIEIKNEAIEIGD